MTIGEKIRFLRGERRLTQKSLCDGIVTRNMLSEIENGVATPSLATLTALAERLAVPVAYFLSEEDNLFPFLKARHLPDILSHLRAGRYREVIRLCEKYFADDTDDEIAYMLAFAYTEEAQSATLSGKLDTALSHLQKANGYAAKTVYATAHLRAKATLLGAVARNVQSPALEFDREDYLAFADTAVESDLVAYVLEQRDFPYINPLYRLHLQAKDLLRVGNYPAAYDILQQLLTHRHDGTVNSLLLFRLYADMEICSRELKDYENAYKYASKRIALLTAFRS